MRRFAASLVCAALGCATGADAPGPAGADPAPAGAGGLTSGFPDRDALDLLLAAPLPEASSLATRFREVEAWELAGPFPEQAREQLDVAVAVPVRRPEGEAWGRYVVLLLAADPPRRRL